MLIHQKLPVGHLYPQITQFPADSDLGRSWQARMHQPELPSLKRFARDSDHGGRR
jgi:hypothetical protein